MRSAALLVVALLLAGCSSANEDTPISASTYRMSLAGVPSDPVAPGSMFNVSVEGHMGMGMAMHRMTSDHIGAHFWNMTVADPTAGIGSSTACVHQTGEMPAAFTAKCTAPMQPGTYHLRAHTRMMDGNVTHNFWSDAQTFTVA